MLVLNIWFLVVLVGSMVFFWLCRFILVLIDRLMCSGCLVSCLVLMVMCIGMCCMILI